MTNYSQDTFGNPPKGVILSLILCSVTIVLEGGEYVYRVLRPRGHPERVLQAPRYVPEVDPDTHEVRKTL